MAKSKYTNMVCYIIIALMLVFTIVFINGEKLGIIAVDASTQSLQYEDKLFTQDTVHAIDIVVDADNWQKMLDNATAEEYINCDVVIDGKTITNVAIRPKGNSSLSTVASSDFDRYSFKIEFDHYNDANTYYGLDKLSLNNIIQDNTYLKDFLSYDMMRFVGADTPLCSFVYITVNSEDWGLYLAVEGVEESFAQRNYGSDYGLIYKPDSMDLNQGFGNGNAAAGANKLDRTQMPDNAQMPDATQMPDNMQIPDNIDVPEDGQMTDRTQMPENVQNPDSGQASGTMQNQNGGQGPAFGQGDKMGGGGMSNSATSLIYTDDEYDSYSSIFDNAAFAITNTDKDRLIASLKQLNSQEKIAEVVNVDEVINYFVAHTFVINGDSYTGNMIHNYYLYEDGGVLSMIAWDYNLAFGGFSMGKETTADDATSLANSPIDDPVTSGTVESRPMLSWIFSNEVYLEQYHQVFADFIEDYFTSGYFENLIDSTREMIAPYVEKDPTAFCSYEEFLQGSATLKDFCLLRAESIKSQLAGEIPSTSEGQEEDASSFIDASSITMTDMGSSQFGGAGRGDALNFNKPTNEKTSTEETSK